MNDESGDENDSEDEELKQPSAYSPQYASHMIDRGPQRRGPSRIQEEDNEHNNESDELESLPNFEERKRSITARETGRNTTRTNNNRSQNVIRRLQSNVIDDNK